jgi:CheY-like chemotaxis protein
MKRIRILLADDHAVVRQGFKMILGAQPDMEIVGEAGNGREAVELAENLKPDIVVMDVAMPELNGIEATRRLAASVPQGLRGCRPGLRRPRGGARRRLHQPRGFECGVGRLSQARHQSH